MEVLLVRCHARKGAGRAGRAGKQESREGRESKGNGRGKGRGNVEDEGFYPVYVCGGSGPD